MKNFFAILLLSFVITNVDAAPAKPFELNTLDGKVSLDSLKGKVVYLDFWASWCSPCKKSFPWMNKMYSKYKDDGLEIVAVSLDFKMKHTKRFLEETPANFTIALDPKGEIADAYQVQVMPTSYLIDRNGELLWEHKGFRTKHEDKLEAEFVKALKNK